MRIHHHHWKWRGALPGCHCEALTLGQFPHENRLSLTSADARRGSPQALVHEYGGCAAQKTLTPCSGYQRASIGSLVEYLAAQAHPSCVGFAPCSCDALHPRQPRENSQVRKCLENPHSRGKQDINRFLAPGRAPFVNGTRLRITSSVSVMLRMERALWSSHSDLKQHFFVLQRYAVSIGLMLMTEKPRFQV